MSASTAQSWRRFLPRIGGAPGSAMDARTLYSLSALLVLVQLPHVLSLPIWVSALGILLVSGRLVLLKNQTSALLCFVLSPWFVTALAAICALLIKWDYGYFLGRDPCVAFLFVLVAAKFAEVRRAQDATLLLCLCAFLLLTQYFYSQTILSALVTLPAVIALTYSLAILRDANNPQSTRAQLKLVISLLLQGLPLAAMLFIVFPRLPGPMWSLPEDAMATTGLSDSMSPGSIGQLSQSAAVAFRVEFDDQIPDASELYWRGPVLTQFDGRNWTLSRSRYDANPRYGGPADQLISYTVTLQPHRQRWLFALDTAASLPTSYNAAQSTDKRYSRRIGNMYSDGQILAVDTVSQALRYRQSSVLSTTLPVVGRPSKSTLFLPGRNQKTIAFAKQLRASSTSDSDYAQSLLRHFNEEQFRYTLQPQILGHAPIDEFLFDSREGFCEHYASAFVVLMRAAGIPSRVVTGYQGGEMNDDYMIVRQSDAHAWAEALIDGAWQRFDPTNAVAPSRIEQGLAAALPNETSVPRLARQAPGFARNLQLRWDALNHHWQRLVIDFDNDSQASLWQRIGLSMPELWQICLGVIAVTGVWSVFVLGMPRFGRRRNSIQEHLWLSLCQLFHAHKLKRKPDESQSEYLRRAADIWPAHRDRLERLDATLIRLRFQPQDSSQQKTLLRQMKKDLFYFQWKLLLSRTPKVSSS